MAAAERTLLTEEDVGSVRVGPCGLPFRHAPRNTPRASIATIASKMRVEFIVDSMSAPFTQNPIAAWRTTPLVSGPPLNVFWNQTNFTGTFSRTQ